ncbi:hypothetical protein J4232_04520 [Candidatus Woesearchaeota archaeon]|nr:hypothetical protein [Candidatus Woesearchaeota archaeon]
MSERRLSNQRREMLTKYIITFDPFSRTIPDFSKYNIVMVDDNKDMVMGVQTYLALVEHFSVIAVSSPYIARELIDSYRDNRNSDTTALLKERATRNMNGDYDRDALSIADQEAYLTADITLPEDKSLSQIYQEGIIVIVSDAKMGGINGFQLLKYVAQQIPATYRLILSAEPGFVQQRGPEELFEAGALSYIDKGQKDYESVLVKRIKQAFGEETLSRNLSTLVNRCMK